MIAAVLLAYDPNSVKPGWIALVLVVILCLVTYLLWRNMNSQIRKIQMPAKPARPPIPQSSGPDRQVARQRSASPEDDYPPQQPAGPPDAG